MIIQLLDGSLIRRHGKTIINVDPSMGRILINKRLGKELAPNIEEEVERKMMSKKISNKMISESENKGIFPKKILDVESDVEN